MILHQYQSMLRSVGLTVSGALVGVVATLLLMQYQGRFEVRFSHQDMYIMLDGNQCDLIASPTKS
jgi:hypothetical protein